MEERHSDMVSEIQRERVLSEVVSVVQILLERYAYSEISGTSILI